MPIGTDVKIGWNAEAARRGFAGLSKMFAGGLRGFRQVGIGMAREAGARMTDMLGRVLMALPEGIKETMDWAGNLTDMSAQTGVAVSKLVLMEEALRLAGASARDTSMMISRLRDNLYEARTEAGPAREALNKLGLFVPDLEGMSIDQAFEKIGRQVGTLPADFEGLESIMADLFGARMGYKMIRFFRDFEGGMKQAENNVGAFANRLDATAGGYDQMSDALGRFQMRWRETMAIIIDEVVGLFGSDWVDQMFDFLAPEKIRYFISNVKDAFKVMMTGDFWKGLMNDIGRSIGDGIIESIKGLNPLGTGGGMLKFLMPQSSTGPGNAESKLSAKIDRSNMFLQQIAMKPVGFA